jgi:lipopolysaccharide/colanic/teichoic acid biosynthesis glycosyltransferase
MEIRLPKEKFLKTYKRYSLPVQDQELETVKKMEFFYIGGTTRHMDKLKEFFEFGYTTSSVDHAMITLRRLLKKTDNVTIPDAIIAEAGIGMVKLTELHRFLAEYKVLADMPFIVEATALSRTDITDWKRCSFIDEIIYLTEFTAPQLLQKVNFLKKIKQRCVHQPATCKVERSFPLFSDVTGYFKRALDVAISASLLLLLSPVMLLIALVIRLESNGPVLTGNKRVGRGYKIFDLLKFRVTVPGSSHTKTGLFLRKTGLDDLPQLLNVFLGDLSLVGYKPLMLHEAAMLTTNEAAKRFLSPAGITGLWQFRKSGQEDEQLIHDIWANTVMQKTNA